MLAEVTQASGNTIGLSILAIVVPVLYWYSRHQVDKAKRDLESDAAKAAKLTGEKDAAIASLEEELARKRLVLIEAEEQVKRLNALAEEAALSRLELIRDLSKKIEEEDARQRDLRHTMRDENRKANTVLTLRWEESEAALRAANIKIAALEARIRALEAHTP